MFLKAKLFLSLGIYCFLASGLSAADFTVRVKDDKDRIADYTVVSLLPLFEVAIAEQTTVKAVMRQQGTQFRPFVLPVPTGTSVSFPNFDEFRHHVYSFSKAKRLELRLYGKDASNEILFDKAGVVALGCNIHDNMLSYIYVTDDPYYRVADDDGAVQFFGLPAGKYKLTAWHPDQKKRRVAYTQEIEVTEGSNNLDVIINMRSVRRRQKGADESEYN